LAPLRRILHLRGPVESHAGSGRTCDPVPDWNRARQPQSGLRHAGPALPIDRIHRAN
jgi:hypothetical protein